MMEVLILVCSITLHPSPKDCQRDNAVDVLVGPSVSNEVFCGLHGQAYYAELDIAEGIAERGEYVKIGCTRSTIGEENVG